jgi:hypothetical protein
MRKPFQRKSKKALLPRKDFLDTTALIRSIQRAEGNPDCFRQPQGGCDQLDCTWRNYCLEDGQVTSSTGRNCKREKEMKIEQGEE